MLIAAPAARGQNGVMKIRRSNAPAEVINRRTALGALGSMAVFVVGCGDAAEADQEAAGTDLATSSAAPRALSCVVTPAQTEGPFFVDEHLLRADLVAADPNEPDVQRGVPLLLKFGIFTVRGNQCTPMANATVDVWHSNASGLYSDEYQPDYQEEDTRGKRYLRGYQVTDASGQVAFKTIYPGAYPGRTIHIHFKIRTFDAAGNVTSEFTSQVYFDDHLSDTITYNRNRRVRNPQDDIYLDGGSKLMLDVTRDASGNGYVGTFNIGVRA